MTVQMGVRIGWADLPVHVRTEVEKILGGTVTDAVSQPGGFSPGTADRVRTTDGTRAFVKAVSPALNEGSVKLHRREARMTAALPPAVPAPQLIGAFDDGEWVVLVLEDVDGRHPHLPWRPDELTAVLNALAQAAEQLTPPPLPDLRTVRQEIERDLRGWERIASDPPEDLDPWIRANLERLIDAADAAMPHLDGGSGVHLDIRADNLLVRPNGSVVIVDWPWLSVGAPWIDSALLLANVMRFGNDDVASRLREIARRFDVAETVLVNALIGLAGFFVDAARHPPIQGLPTVAEWRRANGSAMITWLSEHWSAWCS